VEKTKTADVEMLTRGEDKNLLPHCGVDKNLLPH
jgi:hypothetical protein